MWWNRRTSSSNHAASPFSDTKTADRLLLLADTVSCWITYRSGQHRCRAHRQRVQLAPIQAVRSPLVAIRADRSWVTNALMSRSVNLSLLAPSTKHNRRGKMIQMLHWIMPIIRIFEGKASICSLVALQTPRTFRQLQLRACNCWASSTSSQQAADKAVHPRVLNSSFSSSRSRCSFRTVLSPPQTKRASQPLTISSSTAPIVARDRSQWLRLAVEDSRKVESSDMVKHPTTRAAPGLSSWPKAPSQTLMEALAAASSRPRRNGKAEARVATRRTTRQFTWRTPNSCKPKIVWIRQTSINSISSTWIRR